MHMVTCYATDNEEATFQTKMKMKIKYYYFATKNMEMVTKTLVSNEF